MGAACLLLLSPILVTYAVHFLALRDGVVGTGFLQYDQAYYMANAREHFDSGTFAVLYGLPNSPFSDTPRIYAQLHSLGLGWLQHLSGAAPGHVYVAFGLLAGLVCIRIAVGLYADVVQPVSRLDWLGLPLFLWGGGLLAVAGVVASGVAPDASTDVLGNVFRYDPFRGLWFLNLGRNLFYSTESFYHALFLGAVLLARRRRFAGALAATAALSASSPFAGAELLGVLATWTFLERAVLRGDGPPWAFLAGLGVVLGGHVGYYLGFLPTSPEHRALMEEWAQPYFLGVGTAVLAYLGVLCLAAWRLQKDRRPLGVSGERLLLVWAGVAFALANHEVVLGNHQPLHFTRGHVWTPLFLLGAPVLARGLAALARGGVRRQLLLLLVFVLGLADNGLWFGLQWHAAISSKRPIGLVLDEERREVLRRLGDPRYEGGLVISADHMLGYMATVYTPLRSWASHGHNTPHYARRVEELQRFFELGQEPEGWRRRPVLAVSLRDFDSRWRPQLRAAGFAPVSMGRRFVIYERLPAPH